MRICYIPPVIATVTPTTQEEISWIEQAFSDAIQNTIIDPFQNWCWDIWCGFVDASFTICTMTSLIALVFAMIGVKKAKQWVIIPIIIYLFIQLINYIAMGGR